MMGSDGDGAPPDLASVLQALASFAPPQAAGERDASGLHPQQGIDLNSKPSQQPYQPWTSTTHSRSNAPFTEFPSIGFPTLDPRPRPQLRGYNERPRSPAIDPATITEWPLGLKCVNYIAQDNPNFKPAVRKVNNSDHHAEWYRIDIGN